MQMPNDILAALLVYGAGCNFCDRSIPCENAGFEYCQNRVKEWLEREAPEVNEE